MGDLIRTLARSSLVHGLFAAVMLGAWGFWANRMHPMPAPLLAALVQGALSATIAVAQKKIMERVYGQSGSLALPVLASAGFALVAILVIHSLARTPEILATISLPWTMGVIYSTIYTLTLHRLSRAETASRD